jgi:hypothetical protein
MPRLARIDAPGVLHHFMIRGIEHRKIFLNNKDREDFLERLFSYGTLVLKQLVAVFLKSVSVFLLANFENFHDY